MNAKNEKPAMKALMTGLILSGLTLGSLGAIGCDQVAIESGMGSGSAARASASPQPDAAKLEVRSGVKVNHNETFLTAEDVA